MECKFKIIECDNNGVKNRVRNRALGMIMHLLQVVEQINFRYISLIMNQKSPSKAPLKKRITPQDLQHISLLNDHRLYEADENGQQSVDDILQQIYQRINALSGTTNRKSYFHCLAVYHYNLAYINNKKQQTLSTTSAIENCLKNYEYLRGFLSTREENIVYAIQLVKVYLQCCAVMSQIGEHSYSIIYAQKSLEKLRECFQVLHALCDEELCHVQLKNKTNSSELYPKIEKVCFKEKVLHEANKILKEFECLPLLHQLLAKEKQYFQKITQHIYFWKLNEHQNQKTLRKELFLNQKQTNRNILGLHKTSKITQSFHIGSLMSMEFKKMSSLNKLQKYCLLSTQNLKELVLYASVCYFTLATETRFHELDEDLDTMKINHKYWKLHHDQQIKKCKIIHLKAIQIAGKYLPIHNQYFEHLVHSFNKNYKSVLDEIEQVSEAPSFIEQPKSIDFGEPSYEYGIIRKPREINKSKGEHVVEGKGKGKKKTKKQWCKNSHPK